MNLSRREVLKLGLLGSGSILFPLAVPSPGLAVTLSPQIPRFQLPFRVPPTLSPVRSDTRGDRPIDYYSITLKKIPTQILPDLSTEVWTYNGTVPGPTIRQRGGFRDSDQGRTSVVRFINQLGQDDTGEDIKTTTHLHGMASLPQYDGHAEDLIPPDYYKDYYYPNDRAATIWYHDHAIDKTSRNVYMGLAGMYIVEDEEERQLNLPQGEYDVPLILQDMQFASDGELIFYDRDRRSLYGDVMLVNGVPWPYMKVAQRKYRFRVLNASTSRTYQLVLSKQENRLSKGDKIFLIGTDCGLMEEPVELESPFQTLPIGPAERYEFIIDFSEYEPGDQVFLNNPVVLSNLDSDRRFQPLMRFDVGNPVADTSVIPEQLREFQRFDPQKASQTRQFRFQRNAQEWVINNKAWNKNRIDANPNPGDIEIWELTNFGGWVHPVHIHFVDWQIIDRNGRPPRPHERGWKDVFQVGQFETVRVIAEFGRRSGDYLHGRFMMHCHNLVHEDHSMMTQFQVGENEPTPFAAPAQPISAMSTL